MKVYNYLHIFGWGPYQCQIKFQSFQLVLTVCFYVDMFRKIKDKVRSHVKRSSSRRYSRRERFWITLATNQNSLFRSRDWSANHGPVFHGSVGSWSPGKVLNYAFLICLAWWPCRPRFDSRQCAQMGSRRQAVPDTIYIAELLSIKPVY